MDLFSFTDSDWRQTEDATELFARIDPIDGRLSLDGHVSLAERSLPMYDDVRIFCLTSDRWDEGLRVCYLTHEDNLFRLNGTSPPIHEVNSKAPIRITEENVLYYLSFFCFFVHGEEGPFYIVHDLEDKLLPKGFAEAKSERLPDSPSPKQLFRRPRLFGQDEKGKWRLSALVHYSNSLFLADFLVHSTGMIDMNNDESLLADLPCRVHAPLTPGAGLV